MLKGRFTKRFFVLCLITPIILGIPMFILAYEENKTSVLPTTTYNVEITSSSFTPQNLTINVNNPVTWINRDTFVHTLYFTFVKNGSTYLYSDPIMPGTPYLPDPTWTHMFESVTELQYISLKSPWLIGFINITGPEDHDIAIIDVSTSKIGCVPMPTISQGYTTNITIIMENQGEFLETFDITSYANEIVIATISDITVDEGEMTTVEFIWNTTSFAYGNYSISAYVQPVPGETDTSDNSRIDGWLFITIPGDVDGDRCVTIFDVVRIVGPFNVEIGSPNYNPNADIIENGIINIFDAVVCVSHFKECW